jgi:hypothetical protein
MRLKYIIPLVLGALMVVAAMPVNASEVNLNPSQSIADNGHNIHWSATYSESSHDVSSGDVIVWYNWWGHYDGTYSNNYAASAWDKFNNGNWEIPKEYNNQNQICAFILSYYQSTDAAAQSTSVTGSPSSFNRYHKYGYYITPDTTVPYTTSTNTVSLY